MKIKRILSILLTLCMLFSPAPVAVFADGTTPALTSITIGYTTWNKDFSSEEFTYDLTFTGSSYSSINATFEEGYTAVYSYNNESGSEPLISGTSTYLWTVPYGTSVLTVTVSNETDSAIYTFNIIRSRSTDDTLYTSYGGIYLSSHDYRKLMQTNENGDVPVHSVEAENVDNNHKYYYADVDESTEFKLGVDTNSSEAHKRYSIDEGSNWNDFDGYNTNVINIPEGGVAKVIIQILSDNDYYEAPEGWTDKTPNHFTVWVKGTYVPVVAAPTLTLSGSGTENDPYQLACAADFTNLDEMVEYGETFDGKYFKVTQDITMPEGWDGIGKAVIEEKESWGTLVPTTTTFLPFAGIFDGGNYTLTFDGAPLFDCVRTATIKDLKIKGEISDDGLIANYAQDGTNVTANISGVTVLTGTQIAGSGFLGGYASGSNIVTIDNCVIQSGVTVGTAGKSNIGGFAGDFNGSISNSTCAATVYGADFVGGIVGGQGQSMSDTVIFNCTFSGAVEATGNYVGGISGSGYTGTAWGFSNNASCIDIKNCIVTGSVAGGEYVGGILGAEPAVMQCWENGIGTISGNRFVSTLESSGSYVGGIIGYMKSLNKYNQISDNTYQNADKGIGAVTYIDTNYANPTAVEGTTYVNSETEKTGVEGMSKTGQNRTDDPLGTDADLIARKIGTERIYVTIANAGETVVTQESILVSDHNKNGILDIDDALYFAHEYKYEGGAEAGYSSYTGQYGLSLGKLWGDASGAFGYYVNNNSAWSLADEVKKGDYVTAFVYKNADWSDRYSYFDVNTADISKGGSLELTLSAAGYDSYYNPIVVPMEGAAITVNGTETEVTTDAEGKAALTFNTVGTYIVSAVGAEGTALVPPICVVTVTTTGNDNGGSTSNTNITVSFKLLGDSVHGENEDTHTLKSNNLETWIAQKTYTVNSGDTIWDVLKMALKENGMTYKYSTDYGTIYIESITNSEGKTLAEFANGPNSGWMYTLNGEHSDLGISQQKLKDDDVIVFHYTDDYSAETGSDSSADDSTSGSSGTTTKKDNATEEITEEKPEKATDVASNVNIKEFADIKTDEWYYEDVKKAIEIGLLNGVSQNSFAPNAGATRGMLITVLHRYDGEKEADIEIRFTDCKNDEWYSNALSWATETEIVSGYGNGIFGIDDYITRGQLVTILYRYAGEKTETNLSEFIDVNDVEEWAKDAFAWAVGKKLILGNDNKALNPNEFATRAEMAAIFMRYINMIEQ